MTELISLDQAAKLLDLDIETIRRAVRSGDLEVYKFGNRYKTTQAALEKLLEKKRVKR